MNGKPLADSVWKNEFYRLLQSDDPRDVDRAYALKDENLPEVLCKYRAPTEEALSNLREDTVWLSPASRYNDPFDTSLSLDVGPALAGLLRRSFVTDPLPSLDDAQMQKITSSQDPIGDSSAFLANIGRLTLAEVEELKARKKQASDTLTHDVTFHATRVFQESVKTCCFSALPLSMGMWSHYAKQHEGFCVLYRSSALKAQERRHLYPVVYTSERFSLGEQLARFVETGQSWDPNSLSAMHLPVFAAVHKSIDWSYENEWRLIFTDGGRPSGMAIPMPVPAAIYLGSHITRSYRDRVMETAAAKGIACHDVVLSDTTFELRAVPVDTRRQSQG